MRSKFFLSLLTLLSLFFLDEANLTAEIDYFPQEEFVQEYLSKMPWEYYGLYEVNQLGKFWVNDARDTVKDQIKAGRLWEPYIIDQIKRYVKPGDIVIDIGAHMGTITMAMSNLVGENGKVHSFEAERQFFRELVENIKVSQKTNVKPYLAWIGNENKIIEVPLFYGTEYSSVGALETKPYPLTLCKLDDFELKNIALMKIDVECTENAVLDGAYNTIMESRPVIIIEIMGGYGDKVTPEIQQKIDYTLSKLYDLNYKVSKILIDDYLAIPAEKE